MDTDQYPTRHHEGGRAPWRVRGQQVRLERSRPRQNLQTGEPISGQHTPGQSHLITSDGRPCFPIRLISRHEAAKWCLCLCFMPRNLFSSSVALPSLSLLLVQRLFSLGSLWTACSFPTPVRHGSPYYVSPRGVARDLGIPRVGGDASEHALYESRVECNDLQYVGPPF